MKKYLKNTYKSWTPVALLWNSTYISDASKLLGTIPMLIITPLAWVLCTMYLIILVTVIVPLAWTIWFLRKSTRKRKLNTNKYTF